MLCIKTQRGARNVRISPAIELTTYYISEQPRTEIQNRIQATLGEGDYDVLLGLIPDEPANKPLRDELSRMRTLGTTYITSYITFRKNAPPHTDFKDGKGCPYPVIGDNFEIFLGGESYTNFCPACSRYTPGVTCLDYVPDSFRCLKTNLLQGVRSSVAATT
jgi:hypothetical protein